MMQFKYAGNLSSQRLHPKEEMRQCEHLTRYVQPLSCQGMGSQSQRAKTRIETAETSLGFACHLV